jgi:DNA repair exonuclease SbcCD nuclease subunit
LDLAAESDADAITVGGDLFDSAKDAHELRPTLRDILSGVGRPILVIPGNHDQHAFVEELDYGTDVEVLHETPYQVHALGDARLVAVPYQDRRKRDVLLSLRERDQFDGQEVLLIHCSLDLPHFGQGVGDEDRYFPVSSETLAELDFDIYLAGHYHGGTKQPLPNDAIFVYPGSPCSVTKREVGRRLVAFVETEGDIELRPLHTFYYDRFSVTVLPGQESEAIGEIKQWVKDRAKHDTELEVSIDGFIDMPEQEFADLLHKAAEGAEVSNRTRGVSHVLTDPLFLEFEERLQESYIDPERQGVLYERALRAFARMRISHV